MPPVRSGPSALSLGAPGVVQYSSLRFVVQISDVIELLAGRDVELVNTLSDAELHRLLRIKYDIPSRVNERASVSGNERRVLPDDLLAPPIVDHKLVRKCPMEKGIGGCRCEEASLVNHESPMCACISARRVYA